MIFGEQNKTSENCIVQIIFLHCNYYSLELQTDYILKNTHAKTQISRIYYIKQFWNCFSVCKKYHRKREKKPSERKNYLVMKFTFYFRVKYEEIKSWWCFSFIALELFRVRSQTIKCTLANCMSCQFFCLSSKLYRSVLTVITR